MTKGPALWRLEHLREAHRLVHQHRSISFFDDPTVIATYARNDSEFADALTVLIDHGADWPQVVALANAWSMGVR